MYYYITEPTRTREQQQAEERVRELLIRTYRNHSLNEWL